MRVLWRVFGYCKRYPLLALGTLFCAITSTLAGLFPPKLYGWVVDRLVKDATAEWLLYAALGVLGAYFLRDLLNSARIHLNNYFEQNVIYDIRSDLYKTMQRLPLRWFDNRASGDLMTRVSEDVLNMERVIIDGIEQGSVALLQIFGISAALFWVNPGLGAWAFLPFPFLILASIWYTTTAHQRYRVQRKASSAMNSLLLDNLQGIRQIKSFAREKDELKHFQQRADDVRKGTLEVMKAWARYSPGMEFLSACGLVLVVYFGGRRVLSGEITPGQFTEFLFYLYMLYDPIRRLHSLNQLAQAGRAAAERVFQILDTEPERYSGREEALPARVHTGRAVSFDKVSFAYDHRRPVLENITLEAAAGKTIAIVGPTGAGKSTLVNLITRFYVHGQGSLTIDGVDVADIPLKDLRDEIGVVTQEPFLFNATIRYNLSLGKPAATDEEMFQALKAANAFDFVMDMPDRLETVVGERGVKLSVGEKQRLSIARALLKDPPILILDEATASVDTATERLIQEALNRLLENRTSFVIAHRLSTVHDADLICVLERGKIIERGVHRELLDQNGLYSKLCHAQIVYNTIEDTLAHM